MLRLPGYEVLNALEHGNTVQVEIKHDRLPTFCPQCGVSGPRIRRYGTIKKAFLDLPHGDRQVILFIDHQRFQCLECSRTFMGPLPDMADGHGMTKRLVDFIKRMSMSHTFTYVAELAGVDEKTVRSLFREYSGYLDDKRDLITPRVLGIDEISLMGRPRAVFTNIEKKTLVEMLPSRDKQSVRRFLATLDPKAVEAVTADLWEPYHDLARDLFPRALVVADKFHVMRQANLCVDAVRKALAPDDTTRRFLMRKRLLLQKRFRQLTGRDEETLADLEARFPALHDAYLAKETFYDLYACQSRKEAVEAFQGWAGTLPVSVAPQFGRLIAMVERFHAAIFDYWEQPFTNAYTEGANALIRRVFNDGRGYTFAVIRAKVLHAYGSQKFRHPRLRRDVCYKLSLYPPTYGTCLSTVGLQPPEGPIPVKST